MLPNPTSKSIAIQIPNGVIYRAVLYTMHGAQVMEVHSNFDNVDISKLQSGMYLCAIETLEGMVTKKIIKE